MRTGTILKASFSHSVLFTRIRGKRDKAHNGSSMFPRATWSTHRCWLQKPYSHTQQSSMCREWVASASWVYRRCRQLVDRIPNLQPILEVLSNLQSTFTFSGHAIPRFSHEVCKDRIMLKILNSVVSEGAMQLLALNLILCKCKGRRETHSIAQRPSWKGVKRIFYTSKVSARSTGFHDLQALASQSMKNCVRVLSQVECMDWLQVNRDCLSVGSWPRLRDLWSYLQSKG